MWFLLQHLRKGIFTPQENRLHINPHGRIPRRFVGKMQNRRRARLDTYTGIIDKTACISFFDETRYNLDSVDGRSYISSLPKRLTAVSAKFSI